MKKLTALFLASLMVLSMAACSQEKTVETTAPATTTAPAGTQIQAPAEDVAMQYMTPEDALVHIGEEGYTFLDVRKAEDYAESHIPGALGIDMDAAKEGDFQAGVAAMQGTAETSDDTLILICYSGKRYAQATTNVLSALGYDMSRVYTLEGGFKAWTAAFPEEIEAN